MNLERYMSLTDAARRAGQIAVCWSFRGTEETSDYNNLLAMAGLHDTESDVTTDEDTFYLTAPNGAIGFTEDRGEEIEWLYLPIGHEDDDLPDSLVEKETAPAEEGESKFCTNCGQEISRDARFCRYCGAGQVQAPQAAPEPEPSVLPEPVQAIQLEPVPEVPAEPAAPGEQERTQPMQPQVAMPVATPLQQAAGLLQGQMAGTAPGEVLLGTINPLPLPAILAPLAMLKNMAGSIRGRLASVVKNPRVLICAGAMVLLWIVLGILRTKGIGGAPVKIASSLLLISSGTKLTGILGGILGQSVLLAAVISLATGGGSQAVKGCRLLSVALETVKSDRSALPWLAIGAGAALLIFALTGQPSYTGLLAALAPASLVLTAWGQGSGMIKSLLQSVTARKTPEGLQEDIPSLQGIYFGLTAGFALALLLALVKQGALIWALGIFLPLVGAVAQLIFWGGAKPAR